MQQAKNLSETLASDPQMQLPLHPRLSEDVAKVWYNQQTFIVFGGLGDVVLRGKSVESLLPKLVPLLTGHLTVDEIVEQVQGFRPSAVRDALSLLFMQGLLEEGHVLSDTLTQELVRSFQSQLKFYSRYIDYTRALHNRYEVLSSLQASSILVLASGRGAYQFLRETLDLGLGNVTLIPLAEEDGRWNSLSAPHANIKIAALAELESSLQPHDLIILAADRPQLALTRRLNRLAVEHNIPFLRSFISQEQVEIGPAVFASESACYECAHHQGLINLDESAVSESDRPLNGYSFTKPAEQIGASHTALATLALLTKFIPIKTGDIIYRLMPDTLVLEEQPVYQLAGCSVCSRIQGYVQGRDLQVGPEHGENWPTLYHLNTNERTYNLFPKGHQMHYSSKNMQAVERAYKQYRNCESVELESLVVDSMPVAFQTSFAKLAASTRPLANHTGPLELSTVSLLLQMVGGFQTVEVGTGWQVGLRITPSAGGMASQTLYLFNFAIEGLEAGIYHFNPHRRTLERIRQGHFRQQLDRAVMNSEGLPESLAAAIVHTAAHGRVESKYVYKSFRYVYYDSGVMRHSLQVSSQMLGLEMWFSADFYDDELNDLLGIHTTTEFAQYVGYLVTHSDRST